MVQNRFIFYHQYPNLFMKFIGLFALLIFIALTDPTIVVQSDLTTSLINSAYSIQLAVGWNTNQTNFLGPGPEWIWDSQGAYSPAGRELTFQKLFYLSCGAEPILYITAKASFEAYFDGVYVGSGEKVNYVYSYNLSASCGSHNLTVIAYGASTPSGLIYVIKQDQSNCYSCGNSGFWNYATCSCVCLSSCACTSPKIWYGYPSCACKCPQRLWWLPSLPIVPIIPIQTKVATNTTNSTPIIRLISQQDVSNISLDSPTLPLPPPRTLQQVSPATNSSNLVEQLIIRIPIFTYCPKSQYYSQATCSCQCIPQYCPSYYYWNPDPAYCRCEAIIY